VKLDRALELAQGSLNSARYLQLRRARMGAVQDHRIQEAKEAMDKAVKLGTPEPQFARHAQAIAAAVAGDATKGEGR